MIELFSSLPAWMKLTSGAAIFMLALLAILGGGEAHWRKSGKRGSALFVRWYGVWHQSRRPGPHDKTIPPAE